MTLHYFAFGSNMCSSRLGARIPGAESLGSARLDGWRFDCNKTGRDGSGKANILPMPGSVVWGVVYRLNAGDLRELDRYEGGYQRVVIEVIAARGKTFDCTAYASDRISEGWCPFDWYKQHLLRGAYEHALPAAYVAMLQTLAEQVDLSER